MMPCLMIGIHCRVAVLPQMLRVSLRGRKYVVLSMRLFTVTKVVFVAEPYNPQSRDELKVFPTWFTCLHYGM